MDDDNPVLGEGEVGVALPAELVPSLVRVVLCAAYNMHAAACSVQRAACSSYPVVVVLWYSEGVDQLPGLVVPDYNLQEEKLPSINLFLFCEKYCY